MEITALRLPDRFERLRQEDRGTLQTIIAPVEDSLAHLDDRFADMRAAQRGSFMILRGATGAGKSTFLDTLTLFRQDVETVRIPRQENLESALFQLPRAEHPRVVVLESREALGVVSRPELEAAMHAVNMYVRSDEGQDALIVWPVNTDELMQILTELAEQLGGESLFGVFGPVLHFNGPPNGEFVEIAERTVAALNEGASLAALGISEDAARELAEKAATIGQYLAHVRSAAHKAGAHVQQLMKTERYKVWTVVVAGTDAEGDVAALTRGGQSYVDIDRLLTSTEANVVSELKKQPDALGILGTVLDARIIHLDLFTTLAVARTYGSEKLHTLMQDRGMSTKPDKTAADRLQASQLGTLITGALLGTRRRGAKPGGNTMEAFLKLAEIAQTNDGLLNDAIGNGLKSVGLVLDYTTEKDLGTKLVYQSDIYCVRETSPVRIEVMWRKRTGRAEIANYVLTKLNNYGKAIELLS
jgi:DNA (cytosine-5)-methyltransferase 1